MAADQRKRSQHVSPQFRLFRMSCDGDVTLSGQIWPRSRDSSLSSRAAAFQAVTRVCRIRSCCSERFNTVELDPSGHLF
ncbi:MAG: hypothetical protein QOE04_919 [Mycobacterium sp.]|jgi:hypothetical protein|nr:hypothetical protein [Mycobacterium sp.]